MNNIDGKLKAGIFSPMHKAIKWENYSATESDRTKHLAKLKRVCLCMFIILIMLYKVIKINYKNLVNHPMSHLRA